MKGNPCGTKKEGAGSLRGELSTEMAFIDLITSTLGF